MANMSEIMRRREIRKLEAKRDELLEKQRKLRGDLATTRAALKNARRRQ